MNKYFLLTIFLIIDLAVVGAEITCSPQQITVTYTTGTQPQSQTITCTNSDLNNSVTINKIGQYFSTSPQLPENISAGQANKQIIINFDSSAPKGTYYGSIYFSDNSQPIPITINVNEQQVIGCNIDIFPTVLSNIKVQQGQIKTRNILLTLPSCYKDYIDIRAVALQSDEKPIQLGELSLGRLQPGDSIQIPIELNAEGVSTGTYNDILEFNLANSSGIRLNVPSVSITTIVTAGITPITNFSLSELPTCSLSAIEMNLNSTYKMTCTNPNPNINIKPVIDTKLIKGISVQETTGQYIYEFQPIKIGTTKIRAEFLYKNAIIGQPYEQEVRITYSGSTPVSGTNLNFLFYPSLNELVGGDILTILVEDEKTHTIVPEFNLYINGKLTENNSLTVEPEKEYEIRANAIGYIDAVKNFTVTPRQISITINPAKTEYETGQNILISTDSNATLLINDVIISNNYTLDKEGNITIIAKKQGYKDGKKIIKVISKLKLVAYPIQEDFDKGKELYFEFNKNADWEVLYLKDENSEAEVITNGTGISGSFKAKKSGTYWINANGKLLWSNEKIKSNWFKWWYFLIALVIIILIYIIFLRGKGKEEESMLTFAPETKEE